MTALLFKKYSHLFFLRKEHFVMDSEYLVTLLVVVPLALQPDWNNRVRISSLENWAGLDGSFKKTR